MMKFFLAVFLTVCPAAFSGDGLVLQKVTVSNLEAKSGAVRGMDTHYYMYADYSKFPIVTFKDADGNAYQAAAAPTVLVPKDEIVGMTNSVFPLLLLAFQQKLPVDVVLTKKKVTFPRESPAFHPLWVIDSVTFSSGQGK